MQIIIGSIAALAIANIFYWYRAYQEKQQEHESQLRERVAYMLWVAASRIHS